MKKKLLILISLLTISCSDFLAIKPDKKLAVPTSIHDLEALLNNTRTFNISYPGLGEVSAGDFYLTTDIWKAIVSSSVQDAYIWSKQINYEATRNEWSIPYTKIYNANIIIDAIENGSIKDGKHTEINHAMGSALYFRSFAFYNLLQIFASPWNPKTATNDLGVVLRLSSDLNTKSRRANVEDSYNQIIKDTERALTLLPDQSINNMLPDKIAAHAFLSRVYLTIGQYANALEHGLKVLETNDNLLNFNNLDHTKQFPFDRNNPEIIIHTLINTHSNLYQPNLKVVDDLYNLYDENDLRKKLFFKQNSDSSISFKGSYDGTEVFSNSLTVGEIYLIIAECYARTNQIEKAEMYTNVLLQKRYSGNKFQPIKFQSSNDALQRILIERRKELAFRGIRWTDLRRLNKEANYARTLTRMINNVEYILEPNSSKYVFPIPGDVIEITGIEQNRR